MRPTRPLVRAGRSRRPPRPRGSLRGSPLFRLKFGFLVIAVVLSVFGARLVQLQGVDPKSYAAMAAAEGMVEVDLPAVRGDILDRNGEPMAASVDGMMVVADPLMTTDQAPELAKFLANRLDVDYFKILPRLREEGSRFEYIARRVPATLATKVVDEAEKAGFKGLDTRRDPVRDYPAGDVAANMIGFIGTDEALGGFERTFDKQLAGTDGSARYAVGGGNRIPLGESTVVDPVDGNDLQTTIDLDLQWYAQRVLRQTVEDARADSGFAVVVHTETGEIIALADHPTFDASDPLTSRKADLGSRAMSDVFEPGSVEKALTFSALLDAGKVTPRTRGPGPAASCAATGTSSATGSTTASSASRWPASWRSPRTSARSWPPTSSVAASCAATSTASGSASAPTSAYAARRQGILPDDSVVEQPAAGPDRLRPVALGQRGADGRGHQHRRQRRGARLAQPDPGLGHDRRRHRGRHRLGDDATGGQRAGRPSDDADDGARRRPRRRHRAGCCRPGLPRGRQDRNRPAGRRQVPLLRRDVHGLLRGLRAGRRPASSRCTSWSRTRATAAAAAASPARRSRRS